MNMQIDSLDIDNLVIENPYGGSGGIIPPEKKRKEKKNKKLYFTTNTVDIFLMLINYL